MFKLGCICPLPRCGAIIDAVPPIEEKKVILCPTCNRSFCRHCKINYFNGNRIGNEESKDGKCPTSGDLEEDHSFRRCPKCHTPVTHYYGDEVRIIMKILK